jgi:hypothetical protein
VSLLAVPPAATLFFLLERVLGAFLFIFSFWILAVPPKLAGRISLRHSCFTVVSISRKGGRERGLGDGAERSSGSCLNKGEVGSVSSVEQRVDREDEVVEDDEKEDAEIEDVDPGVHGSDEADPDGDLKDEAKGAEDDRRDDDDDDDDSIVGDDSIKVASKSAHGDEPDSLILSVGLGVRAAASILSARLALRME